MCVSANILEKKNIGYEHVGGERCLFLIVYLNFNEQESDFNRSCPRNGN